MKKRNDTTSKFNFTAVVAFICATIIIAGVAVACVMAGLAWNSANKVVDRLDALSLSSELKWDSGTGPPPVCKKSCDLFFCKNVPQGVECEDVPGIVLESCPSYEKCITECLIPCEEEMEDGYLKCFGEESLGCIREG